MTFNASGPNEVPSMSRRARMAVPVEVSSAYASGFPARRWGSRTMRFFQAVTFDGGQICPSVALQ
jgi:hypothetical protein